jgi:hypothetical protein
VRLVRYFAAHILVRYNELHRMLRLYSSTCRCHVFGSFYESYVAKQNVFENYDAFVEQ